jgi:hypothetical protein
MIAALCGLCFGLVYDRNIGYLQSFRIPKAIEVSLLQ